jgi:hypothetical protein
MQPNKGNSAPDLAITINCQISSYNHDDLEATQMKVEAKISVKDSKGASVEKVAVLNDKYYGNGHEIPVGLFFWESSNALRELIRKALDEL